eukprot:10836209-Alexandrium_andersonii.AAC.1
MRRSRQSAGCPSCAPAPRAQGSVPAECGGRGCGGRECGVSESRVRLLRRLNVLGRIRGVPAGACVAPLPKWKCP